MNERPELIAEGPADKEMAEYALDLFMVRGLAEDWEIEEFHAGRIYDTEFGRALVLAIHDVQSNNVDDKEGSPKIVISMRVEDMPDSPIDQVRKVPCRDCGRDVWRAKSSDNFGSVEDLPSVCVACAEVMISKARQDGEQCLYGGMIPGADAEIRSGLTPDQTQKFDEIMKQLRSSRGGTDVTT